MCVLSFICEEFSQRLFYLRRKSIKAVCRYCTSFMIVGLLFFYNQYSLKIIILGFYFPSEMKLGEETFNNMACFLSEQ